jgi:hypothetical protein
MVFRQAIMNLLHTSGHATPYRSSPRIAKLRTFEAIALHLWFTMAARDLR